MNDGSVILDDDESHVRGVHKLSSSEPGAKSASAHSRPGILIFSRRQQWLRKNSRALELKGQLNQTEIRPVNDIRSAPVRELSAQIQETLDHRSEADFWEIFESKRVIFETERKILVRGFGIADRNSYDNSPLS